MTLWTSDCVGSQVAGGEDVATIGGIKCLISNLLGVTAPFIILAAVFMIIFSGIRIILSADNPKELESSYKTLTFAIIGLVGIAASWLILTLIKNLTGAPVTELEFSVTP